VPGERRWRAGEADRVQNRISLSPGSRGCAATAQQPMIYSFVSLSSPSHDLARFDGIMVSWFHGFMASWHHDIVQLLIPKVSPCQSRECACLQGVCLSSSAERVVFSAQWGSSKRGPARSQSQIRLVHMVRHSSMLHAPCSLLLAPCSLLLAACALQVADCGSLVKSEPFPHPTTEVLQAAQ
jgi:hypothetical protein